MNRRDEKGGGAVLTLGIALALFVTIGAATVLIGWFAGIRQAEQVAEIAALAGASAAVGGGEPCVGAEQAAAHNDAALTHCTVRGSGPDVVVEAGVTVALVPDLPGMPSHIERRATAGSM
ncbi:MAG: hypothetical protein GX596_06925 [Propionibacterium sp.]|nr:hypothetical protein [Propionibacterium sp.]